ncbi:hypothetical protein Tco_0246080 [Tanacetum coccineum]
MEISIADQIALDDALVAPANRLKIGKCNLSFSSDVTSKDELFKEPTMNDISKDGRIGPLRALSNSKIPQREAVKKICADEGTGVTPGVLDAPAYDSDDDISWKSSDDDQDDDKLDDDKKAQDDEDEDKNDDNETTQDDEDDDLHDDDENTQDDDDEAQTESEDVVQTTKEIEVTMVTLTTGKSCMVNYRARLKSRCAVQLSMIEFEQRSHTEINNSLIQSMKNEEKLELCEKKLIDKMEANNSINSQSAPAEETMQSTDVFDAPAHQEFETGVHDEQVEEEVHHFPVQFQ